MHRNVEVLIGRLATDATLRKRFAESPSTVLQEMADRGLELTSIEIAALAALEPEALYAFAGSLDRRLCRAMTETTHTTEEL